MNYSSNEGVTIYETDTNFGHYQVIEMPYNGRPARLLYSGDHQAMQSGIPLDDDPRPLFYYAHRFLELVSTHKPQRILFIGGGVLTLPMSILHHFPNIQIDSVEPDIRLDDIAKNYFGLTPLPNLHIIHNTGRAYLESNHEPYDMILIDAFVHAQVPNSLTEIAGTKQLRRNITAHGIVALNFISALKGEQSGAVQTYQANFEESFASVTISPASPSPSQLDRRNLILVASPKSPDMK